jgi:uncharacterized membrane protein YgcG
LPLVLCAIFVLAAGGSFAQQQPEPAKTTPSALQTNPQLPAARTGQINDFAHALNDDTRQQVEEALAELKKRSQIDFTLVLVNTTAGKPIGDFAKAIFQVWKIGGSGEGVLMLFATDDRHWQVQTSRGLTRDLADDKLREVGTLMNPSLAQEHYNDAVRRGVEGIIKILAARRGFAPIKIPAPLLPS